MKLSLILRSVEHESSNPPVVEHNMWKLFRWTTGVMNSYTNLDGKLVLIYHSEASVGLP